MAIVFVHGLTGSNESWRHAHAAQSWPQMIRADADLQDFDVFTVDYDSFIDAPSPSIGAIYEQFERLLWPLANEDEAGAPHGYKHIVFIAHSLGGLIVERYLAGVIASASHPALNRIRLVFLLGTPHLGSHYASFFAFFSRNDQFRVLVPESQEDFKRFLHTDLHQIVGKHEQQLCATLRILAGYEGLDTRVGPGSVRVVNKESAVAVSHACQEFPFDHKQLSKPESQKSPLYADVKRLLVACAREDMRVGPPPPPEGCQKMRGRALAGARFECSLGSWKSIGPADGADARP